MSGICGWMGDRPVHWQGEDVLSQMSRHLSGDDPEPPKRIQADASGVAARSGLVPVSLYRTAVLAVALQGSPRWSSSEYQTIAEERGSAAALAAAYLRHGDECLDQVRGPFATAIVDSRTSSGLLAIDRMGVCTLCYATPPGFLVFGTTADSVAAHPSIGRSLSPQAIFNYLYCHVVPSPGTIFQGVHKMMPGECIAFRQGMVARRFYWHLNYHAHSKFDIDSAEKRFRALLREAMRRHIDGDASIGAFLSGGTDSSTIAGLLTELSQSHAKTYSIGFSAEGFDEMNYARVTARHFSTQAHEYYVTPADIVAAIPIIAKAYDEPFGNESAVPTYFCAKMARADGIAVILAGDGGDEIFGGNARYAKQKVFEAYGLIPGSLRRLLIEPMAASLPAGNTVAPIRKFKSYVAQASIPLPDRLEAYNFLHRSPLSMTLEPDFAQTVDVANPLDLLREVYNRTLSSSPVHRMMHLDLKSTLADNDLRKVSRMCEMAGLEVRFPLLDHELVEFSAGIPASLQVSGLTLRYFFKRALKDFLPRETLTKTKHGFGLPFGLWVSKHKPLADIVHESLHAFQRRGIVRSDYIRRLLHEHETGHATYFGTMLWVLTILEQWLSTRRL